MQCFKLWSKPLVDSFLAVISLSRLWQQRDKKSRSPLSVIRNLRLVH